MIDRDRYLTGDCALLAIAVWRLTGWPLAEVAEPYHVMARLPDGRLLDAAGLHEPALLEDLGIPHREVAGADLAAGRFGLLAAAPDVVSDARELLAACGLASLR